MRIPLSLLRSRVANKFDAFICSSSFERRCYSVASHIDCGQFGAIVIGYNKRQVYEAGKNMHILVKQLGGARLREMELVESDPLRTEDSIHAIINDVIEEGRTRLLIDISTFTREQLLILINQLYKQKRRIKTVVLAYTGASQYSLGDKAEHIWLSHGVRNVRSVDGFPGSLVPKRKNHLIILLGFETDRAARLIEQVEPSILSIGSGPINSSISKEHYRVNEYFRRKLVATYANVHQFEFPPNDPANTRKAIGAQINKFPGSNILVAPMNTKLSTVGAALLAFEQPDVQLVYAQPDIYNYTRYSRPGRSCYLYSVFNR